MKLFKNIKIIKFDDLKSSIAGIIDWVVYTSKFVVILNIYIMVKIFDWFIRLKYFPGFIREIVMPPHLKFQSYMSRSSRKGVGEDSISMFALIEVSLKNMMYKKSRSLVTVLGMSIGIAAIVFLVSLGFGLQKLVTDRAVKLEEMKQADAFIQPGSLLKITDETVAKVRKFPKVTDVEPVIATVAKVTYRNSVTDMPVYGVTGNYLKNSAIKPTQGAYYSDDGVDEIAQVDDVQGAKFIQVYKSIGDEIEEVVFTLPFEEWIPVYENPETMSIVIGYTKRIRDLNQGFRVYGSAYKSDADTGAFAIDVNGVIMGRWLKSEFLLWDRVVCNKDVVDCVDGLHFVSRDSTGGQSKRVGFIKEGNSLAVNKPGDKQVSVSDVLGVEDEVEDIDEDFVIIDDISEGTSGGGVKKVTLPDSAIKQAVVNSAMLRVLGITDNGGIGEKFEVSFVVTSDLLEDSTEKVESLPVSYQIMGVVPTGDSPFFYAPFSDVKSLGIANYSQLRLITSEPENLAEVRSRMEVLGFSTTSVADTKQQIDSLFGSVQTLLAIVGSFALGVASLGMFNTLTVSLLERTREVGLMKAMGMSSTEVRALFLTESLIMGFYGGIVGVILGFIGGKVLGLGLSVLSISQGDTAIDVAYLPPSFLIGILVLSLFVGLVTGIFPAKRATKISALNALRYE